MNPSPESALCILNLTNDTFIRVHFKSCQVLTKARLNLIHSSLVPQKLACLQSFLQILPPSIILCQGTSWTGQKPSTGPAYNHSHLQATWPQSAGLRRVGGSCSPQRKPTQTWGEHANSSKKDWAGIEPESNSSCTTAYEADTFSHVNGPEVIPAVKDQPGGHNMAIYLYMFQKSFSQNNSHFSQVKHASLWLEEQTTGTTIKQDFITCGLILNLSERPRWFTS